MSWAPLTLKNLTNALHEVTDWKNLGIQLNIGYHELEKFASDYQNKTDQCKPAMLQFWLDSDVNASWEKLVTALDEMKKNRVVKEIIKKYQMLSEDVPLPASNVTTPSGNFLKTTPPSPSTPTIDSSDKSLTTQSGSIPTRAPPSAPPTDRLKQSGAEKVGKMQLKVV